MTVSEPTTSFPVTAAPGITPPPAHTTTDPSGPNNSADQQASTGHSPDPTGSTYVPVLSPVLRLLAGVVVIIAALWWSLHFDPAFDRFGYIPVMFVYMIIMIIGGALMVTGAVEVWSRLTTPHTPHQDQQDR
jgi:hypothetical protein